MARLAEPGANRPGWVLVGAILLFGVFDRVGNLLQSGRGEAGWILCALVIGMALLFEVAVFRRRPAQALRELGFRATGIRAIFAAAAVAGLMLLFFPLAGKGSLRSDWLLLLPGLFAQHGLAEETLFRGFVFRHLRAHRSFARAALLSTLFFVAVSAGWRFAPSCPGLFFWFRVSGGAFRQRNAVIDGGLAAPGPFPA